MKLINPIRICLVALVLAASWATALLADPPAGTGRPLRYLIVLKPDAEAHEPDVHQHGGRELSRRADRRLVEIPRPAIAALSRHPAVAYLALINDGTETDAPRYVRGQAADSVMRIRTDTGEESWDSGVYSYDGAGNITAIGSSTFRYDKAQRLAKATIQYETIDYTYDSFGNQTERKIDGAVVATPASLLSNKLLLATYDRAGNQLSDIGDEQSYRYDGANMMVERQALASRRYIYTADDERIGVRYGVSPETHWTIRDFSGHPLATFASYGLHDLSDWEWLESHHYRGSTLTSAIKLQEHTAGAGKGRYFHVDHLGTPRLITNQDRRKIALHDYHPFGKEQTRHNQELTDWQYDKVERMKFTGHERDFTTSVDANVHDYLDYMHARFYNPSWGRFLSVDPLLDVKRSTREPQSWNRYSYVVNNPINRIDPDGRMDGNGMGEPVEWRCPGCTRAEALEQSNQIAAGTAKGAAVSLSLMAGGAGLYAFATNAAFRFTVLLNATGIGIGMTGGAAAGIRVSNLAPDWATKGFHLHVKGVELAMRPGQNGTIVFKQVFSSTSAAAARDAIKVAESALKDPAARQVLYREASRARDYLAKGDALARSRSGEMHFLMKALEKLGLQ